MDNSSIIRKSVSKFTEQGSHAFEDKLAVEEPLEIRLRNEPLSVTMRTPGDDYELAAGFLLTEGIIKGGHDLGTISYCHDTQHAELKNIVNVTLVDGIDFDLKRLKRNFYATSSCGICGKAAIQNIKVAAKPIEEEVQVKLETLYTLPDRLRSAQSAFEKTGGLHAAGIFDLEGNLLVSKEDVGRHNAVDKAIGSMILKNKMPLNRHILMISGRASFEIMQKALVARLPMVVAVSAPSSLAVQFAQECGITLIGFLRGKELNVYAGKEHIAL